MKTLKDKEIYVLSKDKYIFEYRDVKEAILEYENFLRNYYKSPKYEMILNIHLNAFKKIFGEWKE